MLNQQLSLNMYKIFRLGVQNFRMACSHSAKSAKGAVSSSVTDCGVNSVGSESKLSAFSAGLGCTLRPNFKIEC